jgi:hypothetical protein
LSNIKQFNYHHFYHYSVIKSKTMTVLIQLTTAGSDTGPFNLYSDLDSFGIPFEVGVNKATLQAGYLSSLVPDFTTTIRVCSTSLYCSNCIDITVEPLPTTTTSTTTVAPYYTFSVVLDPCSSATPTFTVYSSSSSLGIGVSVWQDTALTIPYTCSAGGPGNFCFIGLASNPLDGYWTIPDGSNIISDAGPCA